MRSFQDTFEARKRSFISAFSICMTVPLNLKSIDRVSIYFTASEQKKSFLKASPYLYMSPSEWYGVIHFSNSSYLC